MNLTGPRLPGISWRGTCAKLKPLAVQASLTSLQFRALKSALAATDSTEKVQMMVSSLSIVHFWEGSFAVEASLRYPGSQNSPAADPQVLKAKQKINKKKK